MRHQRAQAAYPKALHPHVTPDRPFQASSKPRHNAPIPQPDTDGHQDRGRQGCGPKKNETAGCTRQSDTMVPLVPPLGHS
jgi:hypothetical protein